MFKFKKQFHFSFLKYPGHEGAWATGGGDGCGLKYSGHEDEGVWATGGLKYSGHEDEGVWATGGGDGCGL